MSGEFIYQFTQDYMDGHPPSCCSATFRRYLAQDINEDPFAPVGARHVANNLIAGPPSCSEFDQSPLATPRGINVTQKIQFTDRVFEPSDSGLLHSDGPPSAGNRVAGSGAASIGSLEKMGARFSGESSSTTTLESRPNRSADTRADNESKLPHVCGICRKRFPYPARLK